MPELLTRRETPQSAVGRVAGFKSEWWPDLFRKRRLEPIEISVFEATETLHSAAE